MGSKQDTPAWLKKLCGDVGNGIQYNGPLTPDDTAYLRVIENSINDTLAKLNRDVINDRNTLHNVMQLFGKAVQLKNESNRLRAAGKNVYDCIGDVSSLIDALKQQETVVDTQLKEAKQKKAELIRTADVPDNMRLLNAISPALTDSVKRYGDLLAVDEYAPYHAAVLDLILHKSDRADAISQLDAETDLLSSQKGDLSGRKNNAYTRKAELREAQEAIKAKQAKNKEKKDDLLTEASYYFSNQSTCSDTMIEVLYTVLRELWDKDNEKQAFRVSSMRMQLNNYLKHFLFAKEQGDEQ